MDGTTSLRRSQNGALPMRPISLATAAELVRGMSDRTGTDLSTPVRAFQFRNMVSACRGCANPGGCAKLQADNERLTAAPDYCRNKAIMDG
jgi:hypothetical protein